MAIRITSPNSDVLSFARLETVFNECTLKFRRTSGYKGNFGFDWVREGDTNEPLNPWYFDAVMKPDVYESYLTEYDSFHQSWREQYDQFKASARYYVPWLTILPNETAELRMKLEVGRRSDKIKLKVTGSAASVITINVKEVDAGKSGTYYDGQTLIIECNGEFSSQSAIEAHHYGELVGKINLVPNNKVHRIKIALIPTKIANYAYGSHEEGRAIPSELPTDMEEIITNLFKQIYVIPEFVKGIKTLDLTEPRSRQRYMGIKDLYLPVFDSHFRLLDTKKVDVASVKRVHPDEIPDYAGLTAYQLVNKLYLKNDPGKAGDWNNVYKVYAVNFEGFSMVGIAEYSEKTAFLFKDGINGVTAAHEIGHLFGLPHPFKGSKEERAIYQHKKDKLTENIMDYGNGRISFMKYQLDKLKIE